MMRNQFNISGLSGHVLEKQGLSCKPHATKDSIQESYLSLPQESVD